MLEYEPTEQVLHVVDLVTLAYDPGTQLVHDVGPMVPAVYGHDALEYIIICKNAESPGLPFWLIYHRMY